ncbi:unnamed protein product [Tenebrio molitor]|nr:unnamed protein product [Tenebrio molitor]
MLSHTHCVLFLLVKIATAYKAGVVEYNPLTADTPQNTILKNLDEYRSYADRSREQAVDILVFPEYGLTTLVENPAEYAVELTDDGKIITELAAMAKERQMYLVVNLLEMVKEPNKETAYYNTNLVFGRNGTIIAKYRKINLYKEPNLTPGDANQRVTFRTDFGVTFGMFTCFDILFANPSRTLLENGNVTDVIYPTAWFSIMPFYTSLEVQNGYAVANGVNLLAANYGQPKNGHGGTGIYSADGTKMNVYIDGSPSSKLVVDELTVRSQRQDMTSCPTITPYGLPGGLGEANITSYVTGTDFEASKYTLQRVDLTQNVSTSLCHNQLCCTFDVLADPSNTNTQEFYQVAVYDGWSSYNTHIRLCSLVVCANESQDSCGARVNATTKFRKITVKGNFPRDDAAFYTPLTLNYNLQPLSKTQYCDTNNATDSTFVQLTTGLAQDNVLVFGLFGQTNAPVPDGNDPEDKDADPSGSSAQMDRFLIALLLGSFLVSVLGSPLTRQ